MLLPLISALPFHDFLSFQKNQEKKKQGSEVVGTPFGHEALVAAHLESVLVDTTFSSVQSAWLLLLHCASVRACCLTRVVRPSAVGDFTETHDKHCGSVCRTF